MLRDDGLWDGAGADARGAWLSGETCDDAQSATRREWERRKAGGRLSEDSLDASEMGPRLRPAGDLDAWQISVGVQQPQPQQQRLSGRHVAGWRAGGLAVAVLLPRRAQPNGRPLVPGGDATHQLRPRSAARQSHVEGIDPRRASPQWHATHDHVHALSRHSSLCFAYLEEQQRPPRVIACVVGHLRARRGLTSQPARLPLRHWEPRRSSFLDAASVCSGIVMAAFGM